MCPATSPKVTKQIQTTVCRHTTRASAPLLSISRWGGLIYVVLDEVKEGPRSTELRLRTGEQEEARTERKGDGNGEGCVVRGSGEWGGVRGMSGGGAVARV
jgi:hypothetical protein